ncbi:MAG: hypothetical protein ACREU9_11150, partial [Gammaproteobacteria bacterium]
MKSITSTAFAVTFALLLGMHAEPRAAEDPEKEAMKAEMEALKARLNALEQKLGTKEAAEEAAPPVAEAVAPAVELAPPAWPVAGIYTVPDTKDLGQLTGFPWLSGVKVRGWVDTNYVFNFNEPDRGTVNAATDTVPSITAIKGRDVSIEGRTFDIHHNSFNLSLAELEIEKVPEFGGVGFKF